MKKLFLLFFIGCFLQGISQYNLSDNDGETIFSTTGDFSLGTYVTGEVYEMTLCSDDPLCSQIILTFGYFNIDSATFCVYDGNSTSALLIDCNAWGASQSVSASTSNSSGCLTIQFTANTTLSSVLAYIGCTFICQALLADITSDPVFDYNPSFGFSFNSCEDINIDFSGSGVYQNTTYPQNDASSIFTWYYDGNPVHVGQDFSYFFSENGTHVVNLVITDSQGCESNNNTNHIVFNGFDGTVNFSPVNFTTFQLGDTIPLNADITFEDYLDCTIPTLIPDGSGVTYNHTKTISGFSAGQILENIDDLLGICATIEHSYLGDLVIEITCPFHSAIGGPVTVVLEAQDGAGTYLGEPIDDLGGGGPGIGWEYCWTTPWQADYLPNMGTVADSYFTLPAGSYGTSEPLDILVGCELNGDWVLSITDNWSIDDGHIFCWDIYFDEDIYLIPGGLNSDYDTSFWTGTNIVYSNETSAQSVPNEAGTYTYVYSLVDSIGCNSDYYLTVLVVEKASIVSGKVYRDGNSNCVFDAFDMGLINRIVEIIPGPYYATTDENGNYFAYLIEGDYEISLVTNPSDSIDCPTNNIHYISLGFEDTIQNLDFANIIPTIVDLSIFGHASIANPLFEFNEDLVIRNESEVTISNVSVELIIEDWQNLLTSSISPSFSNDTLLIWEFSSMNSGETKSISLYFDIFTASIGDELINYASVSIPAEEINYSNNHCTIARTVVASYDPNCKTVYPKGETDAGNITVNDSLLTYTIFFQNTGTYAAFNIVILDTISPYLDITSFRTLGASHDYSWDISGTGLLTFTFADIMLPDSVSNEPESHGSVSYEIRLKESADVGDVISNTAHIYFDFNEPIVTNTIINTIADSLVNIEQINPQQIILYPNPATTELRILPEMDYNYVVYNLLGERLIVGKGKKINVSELKNGVYFVQVKDEENTFSLKFIKTD